MKNQFKNIFSRWRQLISAELKAAEHSTSAETNLPSIVLWMEE